MNKTQIEWVKNPDGTPGYTWNPITGCLNGCEYCYARKLANTRLRERYLANKNIAIGNEYINMSDMSDKYQMVKFANDPFYPRFWEDRLYQLDSPRLWETKHKPKGIFVCDMSDLFGIGIPEEWARRILDYIRRCPNDRFYLLTKQPQNLIKFSPFPDNCWVGVSATNFEQYGVAGIYLPEIEAKVKFLSFEPLLERITDKNGHYNSDMMATDLSFAGINWVIIGAQTKPTVMPKKIWIDEITEACKKANIPYFLKNNLRTLVLQAAYRGEVGDDYVLEGKLRQEIPRSH